MHSSVSFYQVGFAITDVQKESTQTNFVEKAKEIVFKDRINANELVLENDFLRFAIYNARTIRSSPSKFQNELFLTKMNNWALKRVHLQKRRPSVPGALYWTQRVCNQVHEAELLLDACILSTDRVRVGPGALAFSGWTHSKHNHFNYIEFTNDEMQQLTFEGRPLTDEAEFEKPVMPSTATFLIEYVKMTSETMRERLSDQGMKPLTRSTGEYDSDSEIESTPDFVFVPPKAGKKDSVAFSYEQNCTVRELVSEIKKCPKDLDHLLKEFKDPVQNTHYACFVEPVDHFHFTLNSECMDLYRNPQALNEFSKQMNLPISSITGKLGNSYYLQYADDWFYYIFEGSLTEVVQLSSSAPRTMSHQNVSIAAIKNVISFMKTVPILQIYSNSVLELMQSNNNWNVECTWILSGKAQLNLTVFDIAQYFPSNPHYGIFDRFCTDRCCTQIVNNTVNLFVETLEQTDLPFEPIRYDRGELIEAFTDLNETMSALILEFTFPQITLKKRAKEFRDVWLQVRKMSSISAVKNANGVAIFFDQTVGGWDAYAFEKTDPDPFTGDTNKYLLTAELHKCLPFAVAFEKIRTVLFNYVPILSTLIGGAVLLLDENITLVSRNTNGFVLDLNELIDFDFTECVHHNYTFSKHDVLKKITKKLKTNWYDCNFRQFYLKCPDVENLVMELAAAKTVSDNSTVLIKNFQAQTSHVPIKKKLALARLAAGVEICKFPRIYGKTYISRHRPYCTVQEPVDVPLARLSSQCSLEQIRPKMGRLDLDKIDPNQFVQFRARTNSQGAQCFHLQCDCRDFRYIIYKDTNFEKFALPFDSFIFEDPDF